MDWILYIFAAVIRLVADRKGWLWAAALIIGGMVIYIGIHFARTPRDVVYPENPLSPDYHRNANYLLDASVQVPPDFSKIKGGLLASHIPIVDERDFPRFAKKLRYELCRAASDDLLFYMIVVGGMEARDIDQPLLDASKRLRLSRRRNVEIVIVAPSTISSETQHILEKRGLRIHRIANQSARPLQRLQ